MSTQTDLQREYKFTPKDFNTLRKIANEHTGIVVPDDKFDMYYARISKRIRHLGLRDFKEYCEYLQNNPDTEFKPFINSITTNLTSFFRENHHFEFLKNEAVPKLLSHNAGTKSIRVWSAGCSTGEEPYSIAISLLEAIENQPDWSIKILATDVDSDVLSTAKQGIYSQDRVNGLPASVKRRWFMKGRGERSGTVRVSPELQQIISFKQLNLMQDWPIKKQFDIIFCRNVVIYFDRNTKIRLLDRFADYLFNDGFLIMGHSESLQTLSKRFDVMGKTVYRKNS